MDWVCSDNMEFEFGSCRLFYASYEASRPDDVEGGNPEKGAKMFRQVIRDYPHNLMMRVAYIQFYIIPMMDEDLYAKEKKVLERELSIWQKQKNYGRDLAAKSKYHSYRKFNLYNAVAQKRFEIIKKYEKEIFLEDEVVHESTSRFIIVLFFVLLAEFELYSCSPLHKL